MSLGLLALIARQMDPAALPLSVALRLTLMSLLFNQALLVKMPTASCAPGATAWS